MRTTLEEPPEETALGGPVPRAGQPPSVELTDPAGFLTADAAGWLLRNASLALTILGVGGRLSARIVDDRQMTEAHGKHMGVAETTDVLTFDLSDGPDLPGGAGLPAAPGPAPHQLDADLLICGDEAARQARARGHAPQQELLLYIIHGVLHCLGHDDHDDQAAARMHAEEDRVLRAIGVGATYAREASS